MRSGNGAEGEGNSFAVTDGALLTYAVPVRFTILGSGSGGNCAYLETAQTRLLVDAGFSLRQIRKRLASIGRAPENLNGILLTHEHSDHVQGLVAMGKELNIPVYANRPTLEAILYKTPATWDCRHFLTGSTFEVGDVCVETFSVPHDAQDPVGFLLRTNEGSIGFLTDLGHATKLVLERVRPANVLVLEANHDVQMLQECPHRPWALKQRILSRHGHLSNEAAAEVVEQVVSAELKQLYLGHLSRECNRPERAYQVVNQCLRNVGASHVQLEVTSQLTPSATYVMSAPGEC